MRKYQIYFLILLFLLPVSEEVFCQTRKVTVNLIQPPKEQCIISEIPKIVESQVRIFPNPSKGEITILFGEKMRNSKVSIEVLSIEGRILLSSEEYIESLSPQKKIDLTTLSKGIYLIKISDKDFFNNQRIVLY